MIFNELKLSIDAESLDFKIVSAELLNLHIPGLLNPLLTTILYSNPQVDLCGMLQRTVYQREYWKLLRPFPSYIQVRSVIRIIAKQIRNYGIGVLAKHVIFIEDHHSIGFRRQLIDWVGEEASRRLVAHHGVHVDMVLAELLNDI